MARIRAEDVNERRRIEDELLALGSEREQIAQADTWNRARVRRLVGPARQVGITVRDISRLTGLSTQTLHTWTRDLMRLIPDVHYGMGGPIPQTLEQAVLRTMGEDPRREWRAEEIQQRIPPGWPVGNTAQIADAMENLARWHMIWDSDHEGRYRVGPPGNLSAGAPQGA